MSAATTRVAASASRVAETGAILDEIDEAFVVREAMAELSEDCQEVLDRFFCRDESYRTIGEALSIPSGTIASRISRCLAKLRERFEGRIQAPPGSGE